MRKPPQKKPAAAPPAGNDPLQRPPSLRAFGAILRKRRQSLGITLDALMQKTAISKPYLSNIETGQAPGPASEEKLRRLAKALGLGPADVLAGADWLRAPASVRRLVASGQWSAPGNERAAAAAPSPIDHQPSIIKHAVPRRPDGAIDLDAVMGSGQASVVSGQRPHDDEPPSEIERRKSKIENPITLRPIPLINRVAAGQASEYTDLDYPAGIADQYLPMPDLPDAPMATAFALRVIGDSMSPEYAEGEIIVVGPAPLPDPHVAQETIPAPQDCVVRLGEQENFATTFKRVFFEHMPEAPDQPQDRSSSDAPVACVRLVPLNDKYPTRVVPLDHVTGIYPVLYRVTKPRRLSAPPGPLTC